MSRLRLKAIETDISKDQLFEKKRRKNQEVPKKKDLLSFPPQIKHDCTINSLNRICELGENETGSCARNTHLKRIGRKIIIAKS